MELTYHLENNTFHASGDDQEIVVQVAQQVANCWPGILSVEDEAVFAQEILWEFYDTGYNPHRTVADAGIFRIY